MTKSRALSLAIIALVTAASQAASAEAPQTPIAWQFELKFGPYKASVDEELSGGVTPFADIYGDTDVMMSMLQVDYQVWRGIGSVGVGGTVGYALDDGTAIVEQDDGTLLKSSDETSFNVVPLQLTADYHFDYLAIEYDVPVVPFFKLGLDYWVWWIRDAKDEIAIADGDEGLGGTWGWHWAGGVKLLLDWIDPSTATGFDNEWGVNNTYLFAEFLWADVNDFGSDSSLSAGDHTFLFGLAFEL